MLSTEMTSAPSMRGASRWRAIVVLPTLPEKLMTATFMGDPCSNERVGDAGPSSMPRRRPCLEAKTCVLAGEETGGRSADGCSVVNAVAGALATCRPPALLRGEPPLA